MNLPFVLLVKYKNNKSRIKYKISYILKIDPFYYAVYFLFDVICLDLRKNVSLAYKLYLISNTKGRYYLHVYIFLFRTLKLVARLSKFFTALLIIFKFPRKLFSNL